MERAERLWAKAKKLAKERKGVSDGDDYWKYVVGILKRMMKIKENMESNKYIVERDYQWIEDNIGEDLALDLLQEELVEPIR